MTHETTENNESSDAEAAFHEDHETITSDNPFQLFDEWLALASKKEPNDPNAMALATADSTGLPDVRMVLLKECDESGFVFYTNSESAKGEELAVNKQAALLFHWKSLRRQVRIRGKVSMVSPEESDAYFATRPRQSRIGAWASQQSRPVESRAALWKIVTLKAAQFGTRKVTRPPYWNGYRVEPSSIEFWMDKPFRLHDRLTFRRASTQDGWTTQRLFP